MLLKCSIGVKLLLFDYSHMHDRYIWVTALLEYFELVSGQVSTTIQRVWFFSLPLYHATDAKRSSF